jgi:membrane-bound metal-dependent hydrolase YbcI (DUF457 family)
MAYWLAWVQALSTLSLVTSFFAVIAALLVLRSRDGYKSSKQVLTAAVLHGLAGVLMFATVILFGVRGKRRDWMMNWQFNWFGWSFQVAIVACILHLAAAFMAGYQGSNKYEDEINSLHIYRGFCFLLLDFYMICMIMSELMKN